MPCGSGNKKGCDCEDCKGSKKTPFELEAQKLPRARSIVEAGQLDGFQGVGVAKPWVPGGGRIQLPRRAGNGWVGNGGVPPGVRLPYSPPMDPVRLGIGGGGGGGGAGGQADPCEHCKCHPPDSQCLGPQDCCPSFTVLTRDRITGSPGPFTRDPRRIVSGPYQCDILATFWLKVVVRLPRWCDRRAGCTCPVINAALLQVCKKRFDIYYGDLRTGICSCQTVRREEHDWLTDTRALGQRWWDKKALGPGSSVTLEVRDAPGLTYLTSPIISWPTSVRAIMAVGRFDYRTYIAVKCYQCQDAVDCLWQKLALWEWHVGLRAILVGPGGRPWTYFCRPLARWPECADWRIIRGETRIDRFTTFNCETLTRPELPCDDTRTCNTVQPTIEPCLFEPSIEPIFQAPYAPVWVGAQADVLFPPR